MTVRQGRVLLPHSLPLAAQYGLASLFSWHDMCLMVPHFYLYKYIVLHKLCCLLCPAACVSVCRHNDFRASQAAFIMPLFILPAAVAAMFFV
jgi:hypothetical protein